MVNLSGIHPSGPRLLVLPEQVEEKTKGGIIRFTPAEREREELAQIEGVVVEVGPGSWLSRDSAAPLFGAAGWCSVGDTIIFAKYAGLVVTGADDKRYRLINDLDVVAVKKPTETSNG